MELNPHIKALRIGSLCVGLYKKHVVARNIPFEQHTSHINEWWPIILEDKKD